MTDLHPMEVPHADEQTMRMVEPTPAGKVIISGPVNSRYQPHRSREIFRERQEVATAEEESIEY